MYKMHKLYFETESDLLQRIIIFFLYNTDLSKNKYRYKFHIKLINIIINIIIN